MNEMISGVGDPAVTDATKSGGSDAARIAEVETWLKAQFEAAGKEVPHFEYTPRSIAHLYNLATVSQAKTQAATIVANDFRQKAAEYRSQGSNFFIIELNLSNLNNSILILPKMKNCFIAARIREILENVGLAQESLPSNVVASAQVLANVANLLNIRDTELSR